MLLMKKILSKVGLKKGLGVTHNFYNVIFRKLNRSSFIFYVLFIFLQPKRAELCLESSPHYLQWKAKRPRTLCSKFKKL